MNEIKQLRWRCRRGTLELDLILLRYLDNHYLAADKAEQMAFQQLLALEDIELMAYLMADQQASAPNLAAVVKRCQIKLG